MIQKYFYRLWCGFLTQNRSISKEWFKNTFTDFGADSSLQTEVYIRSDSKILVQPFVRIPYSKQKYIFGVIQKYFYRLWCGILTQNRSIYKEWFKNTFKDFGADSSLQTEVYIRSDSKILLQNLVRIPHFKQKYI